MITCPKELNRYDLKNRILRSIYLLLIYEFQQMIVEKRTPPKKKQKRKLDFLKEY